MKKKIIEKCFWWNTLAQRHFLLSLFDYRWEMKALFSVKIFNVEFSPDLYVLRTSESKKEVFGNRSARMYVCLIVR